MIDLFDKICDEDLLKMFEDKVEELLDLLTKLSEQLCKHNEKVVIHLDNLPLQRIYKSNLKGLKPHDV